MYDELVKALRGFEDYDGLDFLENRTYAQDIAREAADAIEELLAERDEVNADSWKTAFEIEHDEHRWIPVTERLPKEEEEIYLCYTNMGIMCECRWTNNRFGFGESDKWGWSIMDVPQYQKVTHWMPLPEPPKEET